MFSCHECDITKDINEFQNRIYGITAKLDILLALNRCYPLPTVHASPQGLKICDTLVHWNCIVAYKSAAVYNILCKLFM